MLNFKILRENDFLHDLIISILMPLSSLPQGYTERPHGLDHLAQ